MLWVCGVKGQKNLCDVCIEIPVCMNKGKLTSFANNLEFKTDKNLDNPQNFLLILWYVLFNLIFDIQVLTAIQEVIMTLILKVFQ